MSTRKCPHSPDVARCPLYRASHDPHGLGCADGRLDAGGCAIDRGMDYAASVARLFRPELPFEGSAERPVAARQKPQNREIA